MRNPNSPVKFSVWRKVQWFILMLGVVAVMLSVTSLSKIYSPSSLVDADSFRNRMSFRKGEAGNEMWKTVATVVRKIEDEMNAMSELSGDAGEEGAALMRERVRYAAFLADVLGLIESLKTQVEVGEVEPNNEVNARNNGAIDNLRAAKQLQDPDGMADFFLIEEIRKYIKVKPNRLGKQNFMGANGTFNGVGHACFSMKQELEEYMDYDVGDFCKDDWKQAQRMMVHGCDPLPRRRCFSRAPQLYSKPFPLNESLWMLPDNRNVRWSQYRCKNFTCLANNQTRKGFFKCADCFNLTHHEMPRWMKPTSPPDPATNLTSDFLIEDVLKIKPGEIRIGLDFSVGTGTFAARMREFNVTIVSATINLGAPFNEMIALRGLVPLYLTINQRLPFFDNTLDIIHTTRFLDGWIDFLLLDFVLYDWDRVLRPGGLLWIDSFFCSHKDLDDYLDAFKMLRYRKHKWVVVPKLDKDGEEVFFSALLEKPPRPF
ncbi:probable methyltransferase At1g29790 [Aristolochia californica]|uniref:probable methyltransferase At1g29790 n=1 Tax=Aristolochia californica TaxID=171875 RepID=UPI0035D68980